MSCPTYPWCTVEFAHAVQHCGLVGHAGDTMVFIIAGADDAPRVLVNAYRDLTSRPAVEHVSTPSDARAWGQMLIIRGRDLPLGEVLVRAADLAAGGGAR